MITSKQEKFKHLENREVAERENNSDGSLVEAYFLSEFSSCLEKFMKG